MINLYNGDCLEVMDRLIAKGIVVDSIITDVPYGTTACKWDTIIPFDEMWERLNKLIKPNGAIVLFGSEPFSSLLRVSNIGGKKSDRFKKGGYIENDNMKPYIPTSKLRYPKSIQKFNTPKANDKDNKCLHPTQKPIALMEYLIKTYTNEGETVLDFTMGSGSTGVASVNTDRNFIGIELDETYFNIAKQRVEEVA